MSDIKDMDDFLSFVEGELGEGVWVSLYKNLNKPDESEDGSLYSCLVPPEDTVQAMKGYGWDLLPGSGGPSIVTSGNKIWYEENSSKLLPLVIYRDFHGVRSSYREILQELVIYLNLYHDKERERYVVDDDNGTEIEVIRYSGSEIIIRKSFLTAFMSARQCNLLLFFENTRHNNGGKRYVDEHVNKDNISYTRFWDNSYVDGYDTFTRVLGKKLVLCKEITEKNASPFCLVKEYEEFIISGDSHDNSKFTCDESKLSDYFGKNEGCPHYLTPVYFKKEVMQRYYNSPSEYEVQDSSVRKLGYWLLRLDNNSTNHICVFLGDLGRDLPHSEQIYWKSYNIAPEGKEMSNTYFERSMLGKFSDATSPDLKFKSIFAQLQASWYEKNGWHLFMPLNDTDSHCLSALHSLTSNEQSEFDSQVLFLVKATIDSINVEEVKNRVAGDVTGSIKLLANYLNKEGVRFDIATFLGGLQGVRSTGVAHRRGTKYEKTITRLGISDDDLTGAFDRILNEFCNLLLEVDSVLSSTQDAGE